MDDSNFQVYVRIKPTNHPDTILSDIDHNSISLKLPEYSILDKEKTFTFHGIIDSNINNQKLFSQIKSNLHYLLEGYNVSILTYGITGSGKTHTIFGVNNDSGISSNSFNYIKQLFQQQKIETDIQIGFLEIYNETVRDLLSDSQKSLNLIEDARGVQAQDLRTVKVADLFQFEQLIHEGLLRRALAPTSQNQYSSRSHALIQIQLNFNKYSPKLTIIDLAGSERNQLDYKTNLEGANINKSLLALGNCINILSLKQNSHVPFRDSKLTRLLKDSLGGNSRTVLLACISQQQAHYDETMNTLNYASRAYLIKRSISKIYKKDKDTADLISNNTLKSLILLLQTPVVCQKCSHVQKNEQYDDLSNLDLLDEKLKKLLNSRQQLIKKAPSQEQKTSPSVIDRVCEDLFSNMEEYYEIQASLKELDNIILQLSQKSQEYSSYQMMQQLKENVDIKERLTEALKVNENQKDILKDLLFKMNEEESQKIQVIEQQANATQIQMQNLIKQNQKQSENISDLEKELERRNEEIRLMREKLETKEKVMSKVQNKENRDSLMESTDCYFRQSNKGNDPIYIVDNSNKRYSNSSVQKKTNTIKLQQLQQYVD